MVCLLSSMFSYAPHVALKLRGNLLVEDVVVTRSGVGESSWRPQCDAMATVKRGKLEPRCGVLWDGCGHTIIFAWIEGEDIAYIDLGCEDALLKRAQNQKMKRLQKPLLHLESRMIASCVIGMMDKRTPAEAKHISRWFDNIERRLARSWRRVRHLPVSVVPSGSHTMQVLLQVFQLFAEHHALVSWEAVVVNIVGAGFKVGIEAKPLSICGRKLTTAIQKIVAEASAAEDGQRPLRPSRKQEQPKWHWPATLHREAQQRREAAGKQAAKPKSRFCVECNFYSVKANTNLPVTCHHLPNLPLSSLFLLQTVTD